ncbi:hypothetical protein ACL9RF_00140 [Sphingobacterium sp. Mn56C]|uniref:hypothetical protein n=1 Tax=Sphingobacterium sp. Mn56C TaxID=3395261 RepID=UPI003BCAA6C6
MKAYILTLIGLLCVSLGWAQGKLQRIDNFMVKENLTANGKVAIIATDSLDQALETINGTFKFSINGFEQNLAFHSGIAVAADPIDGSTFAYFKHKNQENSTGKLYFLYKSDSKITPIKINGLLLLIIPAIILLIAYAFKRLMSTFIVLAIIYGYFSFSKGLSLGHLFESATQILKSFF